MSNSTSETSAVGKPGWKWHAQDKAKWELQGSRSPWVKFSEYWRRWPQGDPIPNILPICMDPPPLDLGDKIFVPSSYPSLFDRVLATKDRRPGRATLATGQPGVGKTIWLWYALIRLLSQGEDAVLLCWDGTIYLFYFGEVYSRDVPYAANKLPFHVPSRPIIELIDAVNSTLPRAWMGSQVLPILTSPPNSDRFKDFLSQRKPAVYGMNLWNLDELVQAFSLQKHSALFLQNMGRAIAGQPVAGQLALDLKLAVEIACESIRQWKAANMEEGADNNGDMTSAEAVDRDVRILLDVVTAEFGFAPRDVYYAIFHTADTRKQYKAAARALDYEALQKVAANFGQDYTLPRKASREVIAVSPHIIQSQNDEWTIAFKSPFIAHLIFQRIMEEEEEDFIREQCSIMRQVPETSVLAGFYFETLSHREACHGRLPRLIPMACADTESNSPHFTLSPTIDQAATLVPPKRARATPRIVTYVDFADLSSMSLEGERYYIPRPSNNRLFVSFIVAFDDAMKSATISVFQMAISKEHDGSPEGYVTIRKIMKRVGDYLREVGNVAPRSNVNNFVAVQYILVCPANPPNANRVWNMPAGWNESVALRDHRGDVFLLLMPEGTSSKRAAEESDGGPRKKAKESGEF